MIEKQNERIKTNGHADVQNNAHSDLSYSMVNLFQIRHRDTQSERIARNKILARRSKIIGSEANGE